MASVQLTPLGDLVRRHDPERFFTVLFAPAERRETLFTLYAFNHELARASEVAREPMMALIRLQWWREVVEGARRRHEVAGPLGEALDSGRLLAADLAALVDAREMETESVADLAGFTAYAEGVGGGLMVAAARALGAAHPESLRPVGAACGIVGALRNAPVLARHGRRSLLPQDGTAPDHLAVLARDWLGKPTRRDRPTLPAILPAVSARRWLKRQANPVAEAETMPRTVPLGDRLAVLRAALTRRA